MMKSYACTRLQEQLTTLYSKNNYTFINNDTIPYFWGYRCTYSIFNWVQSSIWRCLLPWLLVTSL